MKKFILAILFFIIGILNLDIRIDGMLLNGIPFEAADNCVGIPCLVYIQPERDIRLYILNNVQDVYWNDKYIYAIDSKSCSSPISFVVTYNNKDYENEPFTVSDKLDKSQVNQMLKSLHVDLSKMHHVNINSDEFAITFYLKVIILFVVCVFLSFLSSMCYRKASQFLQHK